MPLDRRPRLRASSTPRRARTFALMSLGVIAVSMLIYAALWPPRSFRDVATLDQALSELRGTRMQWFRTEGTCVMIEYDDGSWMEGCGARRGPHHTSGVTVDDDAREDVARIAGIVSAAGAGLRSVEAWVWPPGVASLAYLSFDDGSLYTYDPGYGSLRDSVDSAPINHDWYVIY
jgi:hypothetical protein